jgi:AcrR family transcriptional regulator
MSPRSQAHADGIALDGLMVSRGGGGREQLSGIQRVRMLSAMVELASECGGGGVTVAHVVSRSGVSRRTFYEVFTDRDDCFLAAFDMGVQRISGEVIEAFEGGGPRWRERVRAGLAALLGFLEREPGLGRLVIVEGLGAGPLVLERRKRVVDGLVRAIDGGRRDRAAGREPPILTAEGVVGAVVSVLHARLCEEHPDGFVDLLNPLMAMIVLPYLGRATADRELERSGPKQTNGGRAAANPLRDLEMRLTYRTVRALTVVAEHPGSSNRTIGEAAGITDQGQISKLLARLQTLGLVENTGAGPARGEPNAWTLTPRGNELTNAITTQPHQHNQHHPQTR